MSRYVFTDILSAIPASLDWRPRLLPPCSMLTSRYHPDSGSWVPNGCPLASKLEVARVVSSPM